MQSNIRESGGAHMTPSDHDRFVREKEEGSLVKPEDAGRVIAGLAISGPESLSGEFVSWDDPRCREFTMIVQHK
jgi:hypothetical protein